MVQDVQEMGREIERGREEMTKDVGIEDHSFSFHVFLFVLELNVIDTDMA